MSTSTSSVKAEAKAQFPAATSRITEEHKKQVSENASATVENAEAAAESAARTSKGLWRSSKDVLAAAPGKFKNAGYEARAGLSRAASATSNGVTSRASAAAQSLKNVVQPDANRSVRGALVSAALLIGGGIASVYIDFTVELLAGILLHQVAIVAGLACLLYAIVELARRAVKAVWNRSTNAAESLSEGTAAAANRSRASLNEVTEPAVEDSLPSKQELASFASHLEATLAEKNAEITMREGNKADAERAASELPAARATVERLEKARNGAGDNAERLAATKAEAARLEKTVPLIHSFGKMDDVGPLKQELSNKNDLLTDKDRQLAELQAQHDAVKAEREAAVQAERDAAREKINAAKADKDAAVQAEREAAKATIEAAESKASKATAEAEASRVDLSNVEKKLANLRSSLNSVNELAIDLEGDVLEADQKQGEARASAKVEQAA